VQQLGYTVEEIVMYDDENDDWCVQQMYKPENRIEKWLPPEHSNGNCTPFNARNVCKRLVI
jgi:hypothetical protein